MHKPFIAFVLVLTSVLACDSPYAVIFQEEHRAYPPGDPRVAALTYPDLYDRLSYGLFKSVCPGKPLRSLEKATEFFINSLFFKNSGGAVSSEFLSRMVSDSLSPEALGYEETKRAMEAAIGTAISSNYSCDSIESAARIYYEYGWDDYLVDVCDGKNSLRTLLGLLEKSRPQSLVAVSSWSVPDFPSRVYERDSSIGEALMKGKISGRKALELLAGKLEGYPLCHEVVLDYRDELMRMASVEDPQFFALYDALLEFERDCPLSFSGYVLDSIDEETLIFSKGEEKLPLLLVSGDGHPRVVEKLPELNISFHSRPLPLKGENFWVEKTPVRRELGVNYLMLLPLAVLLIWWGRRGWEREKG